MNKIDTFIDWINLFQQPFTYISRNDLLELLQNNISVEFFLDYLCKKYGVLLHGSRIYFETYLEQRSKAIFATNLGSIAIMKSLLSNKGCNLSYPYFISEKSPLIVEVGERGEINSETIGEKGYVYIIRSDKFKNDPKKSWQYINKKHKEVQILGKVEILFEDFNYPIIDKKNNKRIK